MKVKYAMSETPHAISVGATVEEAAKVMTVFGVSLLPVIFEGRPVGIVSEHSLVTKAIAWAKDAHRTPIRHVMNSSPTCVNENDDVALARVVLEHSHEHRALVCGDDGCLTGVISLPDLEKAMAGELPPNQTVAPTDNGNAKAY